MRFSTLNDWLLWQQALHPRAIELGLERVGAVADRMGLRPASHGVITVAGTNGKGSTVALLAAALGQAGYRVGAYTSPHLLRYNERVRVQGREAGDRELCEAFARVDAARGAVSLSYFEFGTLAALDVFRRRSVDVAVLEVGLGGRLDAVNILDADAAVVTTVGVDHVEWLGGDREAIGREKAGIFRPGRAAVCADPDCPASVRAHAAAIGAHWYGLGEAYGWERGPDTWTWWGPGVRHEGLPGSALNGSGVCGSDGQLDNAAGALMILQVLAEHYPVAREAVEAALASTALPGRLQRVAGPVERVLDVAHNPQAAGHLARALAAEPCPGRTHLVMGMLEDKDVAGVCRSLAPVVDAWYAGGLQGPRALDGAALEARIREAVPGARLTCAATVEQAYRGASAAARPGDRIVVCGSFLTVAAVMDAGL